jgi:hypothetical protein
MNATSRRKYEMGVSTVKFNRSHPDTDPDYQLPATELERLVALFAAVAAAQREGLVNHGNAAARRHELRRGMMLIPIAHLAEVGRIASKEDPSLRNTFTFKPGANTYVAFRTTAGTMVAAAQAHKDTLKKYGLTESVLDEFVQRLEEFDAATALAVEGRTAHRGATEKLNAVASEIVQTVRVMDARNRQRFAGDPQLLTSWISASTILGTPRAVSIIKDTPASSQDSTTPNAGGVRPAA